MGPSICLLGTVTGPCLVRADALELRYRDSIRQCDIPEIPSTSNKKLMVSGIIALHARIGISLTRVTCGVVDKLAASVLLGTTFVDRYIRSAYTAQTEGVRYLSLLVPM